MPVCFVRKCHVYWHTQSLFDMAPGTSSDNLVVFTQFAVLFLTSV